MKCQNFCNLGSLVFRTEKNLLKIIRNNRDNSNKRHLRADGLPLRPSALRPRLLGPCLIIFTIACLSSSSPSYAAVNNGLFLSIPDNIKVDVNQAEAKKQFSKSNDVSLGASTGTDFGYSLGINLKNGNDNSLINGSDKLISISHEMTEEEFQNSQDFNTWGYKPSKLNSRENTKFQPGPTNSLSTLDKTNSKSSEVTDYNVTLATKTNSTTLAGTYSNTFIITLTANTVSYNINYNLNSGTSHPTSQSGSTTMNEIKISNTTPRRPGYTFKGWCSVSTSNDRCNGTTYQAGQNIPLNGVSTINLWAIWYFEGGCFVADTLIDTPNGPKPLEDIEEKMVIYSYNLDTHEVEEDIVENVMERDIDKSTKITLSNGSTVQGTSEHLVYDKSKNYWKQLGEFQVGESFLTIDNIKTTVRFIEEYEEPTRTYNLLVKNNNNFIIVTGKNSDSSKTSKNADRLLVDGAPIEGDTLIDPNRPNTPIPLL